MRPWFIIACLTWGACSPKVAPSPQVLAPKAPVPAPSLGKLEVKRVGVPSPHLAKCLGAEIRAQIASPRWTLSVPAANRQKVAREFYEETKIPWDTVTVNAFGEVAGATVNDNSKVFPAGTDAKKRSHFWQEFLNKLDPANSQPASFTDVGFPSPSSLIRPVGAVYLDWNLRYPTNPPVTFNTFLWDAFRGTSTLIPKAGSIRTDQELFCLSGLSLPTKARVDYVTRDCLRCNARSESLDLEVDKIGWRKSLAFISNGKGNYSIRRIGEVEINPVASLRSYGNVQVTWLDPTFAATRIDTVSGDDLSQLLCRRLSRSNLLACAPDEQEWKDLSQLLQVQTVWQPSVKSKAQAH